MHTLIVVAYFKDSLTRSLAAEIGRGISEAGQDATFEVADLAGERFDPRFTEADIALRWGGPAPADVLAEQRCVDRADTLIMVYPVYWWSMPALLKGGSTGSSPTAGRSRRPPTGVSRSAWVACRFICSQSPARMLGCTPGTVTSGP